VGLRDVTIHIREYVMCGNEPASCDESYDQVIQENKERIMKTETAYLSQKEEDVCVNALGAWLCRSSCDVQGFFLTFRK
jgi:hypothetical protein